jgi:hypothetical protein
MTSRLHKAGGTFLRRALTCAVNADRVLQPHVFWSHESGSGNVGAATGGDGEARTGGCGEAGTGGDGEAGTGGDGEAGTGGDGEAGTGGDGEARTVIVSANDSITPMHVARAPSTTYEPGTGGGVQTTPPAPYGPLA